MSTTDRARPHGWRRWGGYLALTLVFAVACGLLSWWQWARRDQAVTEIARVERNYDAEPRPIAQVLDGPDTWVDDDEWVPVVAHGEYLLDEQLLVRNRVRGGSPGLEQLVPLRLDGGGILVVDRGWLPVADTPDSAPAEVPLPRSGEVTVTVRLRPAEPTLAGRTAPEGQIPSIDVRTIVERLGEGGYTAAYGVLAHEEPAPADRPAALPRPAEDEGPHLSYALQWIAFGVLAFIGLFWAWRRERRIAALPPEQQAAARAPRRRHEDADVEDAILDRLDSR